jgi:TPR repeat protein
MTSTHDIDTLLASAPSELVAQQLVEWADATRGRIARGDMMLGILTPDEVAKIPEAYRSAAQHGVASAWITLAWWLAYPEFGEPDVAASESALHTAINANVENAKLELAKIRWFFKRNTATERERQEACQMLSEIVECDGQHCEAFYFLGLLTTHGYGIAASPDTGSTLLQKSADLGNADAMFELYIHYAQGLGVPPDEQLAYNHCRKAADAGHPRAMYNIGAFHASGRGVPKSIPEAIKWYERAADAGNPSAMAGLATIYATGDGGELDREYAEEMFGQAEYCGLDVRELREQAGL